MDVQSRVMLPEALIALIDSGQGGAAIAQPKPIFPRLEMETDGGGADADR